MIRAAVAALAILLFAIVAGESRPARADNPFGVMLWPGQGEFSLTLARARGLGVAWFRPPALSADRWAPESCSGCDLYAGSGFKIALTVRASSGEGGRGVSAPPANLALYAKTLRQIVAAWRPAFLVVEEEEDNPSRFRDPDPAFSGYRGQLAQACAAAHAEGAACTNGGLSYEGATALTWIDFLERGEPEAACAFAGRVFPGEGWCAYRDAAEAKRAMGARIDGLKLLVALYRASPVDAVNFHWYGRDARALHDATAYLSRATGKPLVSNEMGLRPGRSDDPAIIRPILRAAFAADLKMAIWYSIDGGGSVSLFDDSGRLRPAGWEFQRQMSGRK